MYLDDLGVRRWAGRRRRLLPRRRRRGRQGRQVFDAPGVAGARTGGGAGRAAAARSGRDRQADRQQDGPHGPGRCVHPVPSGISSRPVERPQSSRRAAVANRLHAPNLAECGSLTGAPAGRSRRSRRDAPASPEIAAGSSDSPPDQPCRESAPFYECRLSGDFIPFRSPRTLPGPTSVPVSIQATSPFSITSKSRTTSVPASTHRPWAIRVSRCVRLVSAPSPLSSNQCATARGDLLKLGST